MLELLELGEDECRRLLRSGVVGRVAVSTSDGPHIVPVNYALLGDDVVFRTRRDGVVARNAPGSVVAFSVDQVDYEWQHGWSVMVHGMCQEMSAAADLERVRRTAPSPWAAGPRELVLRVPCTEITGRQLGPGWSPVADMPVHRVPPD